MSQHEASSFDPYTYTFNLDLHPELLSSHQAALDAYYGDLDRLAGLAECRAWFNGGAASDKLAADALQVLPYIAEDAAPAELYRRLARIRIATRDVPGRVDPFGNPLELDAERFTLAEVLCLPLNPLPSWDDIDQAAALYNDYLEVLSRAIEVPGMTVKQVLEQRQQQPFSRLTVLAMRELVRPQMLDEDRQLFDRFLRPAA